MREKFISEKVLAASRGACFFSCVASGIVFLHVSGAMDGGYVPAAMNVMMANFFLLYGGFDEREEPTSWRMRLQGAYFKVRILTAMLTCQNENGYYYLNKHLDLITSKDLCAKKISPRRTQKQTPFVTEQHAAGLRH